MNITWYIIQTKTTNFLFLLFIAYFIQCAALLCTFSSAFVYSLWTQNLNYSGIWRKYLSFWVCCLFVFLHISFVNLSLWTLMNTTFDIEFLTFVLPYRWTVDTDSKRSFKKHWQSIWNQFWRTSWYRDPSTDLAWKVSKDTIWYTSLSREAGWL